ncbi:MAG: hypothetical protein OH338_05865 [Candidatus Parvarchaeota archaeon]|nr:hypothetical protein [Candidatus Parvarchaeum tengchongense]
MELLDISTSLKKLIVEMYQKKALDANTQTIFSKWSFYIAVSELRKFNLIEPNGSFKGGEVKEWRLTKKGEKVAKLLIQLSNALKSEE